MIFCNHTIFNIRSVSCRFPLYLPKKETSEFDNIISIVAASLGESAVTIKGSSRRREITDARYICIYFIKRRDRQITLNGIGKIFKRDHSTIISALKTFDDLYKTNREFKRKVQLVETKLNRLDVSI